MQFYSFDLNDPIFDFDGWGLSFQIITLENIYGLDPAHTQLELTVDGWRLVCSGLSWAGQQQRGQGLFQADIRREANGRLRLSISATAEQRIRAVKVLIRDLPELAVLDMLDQPREVPPGGLL